MTSNSPTAKVVDQDPLLVVVLSGPRLLGADPTFNANPGRLLAGLQALNGYSVPMLVSGHAKEADELAAELAAVSTTSKFPRSTGPPQVSIDASASHTTDNALVTLFRARELCSEAGGTVIIATCACHMPRALLLCRGLRDLLATRPGWDVVKRLRFKARPAVQRHLDPGFLRALGRDELDKYVAAERRLLQWRNGDLREAPPLLVKLLTDKT